MTLYVQITEGCRQAARSYAQEGPIERVRDQLVQTQSRELLTSLPPGPYVKRSLGRSFRLIGRVNRVGIDEIIEFLDVLPKSNQRYEWIWQTALDDPATVDKEYEPLDNEQLAEMHAELTTTVATEPLPALSDDERGWLYEALAHRSASDDLLILESRTWVERMRDQAFLDRIAVYQADLEALVRHCGQLDTSIVEPAVFRSSSRVGIGYVYMREIHRLLLLEPVAGSAGLDAKFDEYRSQLEGEVDPDWLARVAGRAYPAYMVIDDQAWFAIEKDHEANLALSSEEGQLLEAVRAGSDASLQFPLFINGRAGSGKSTMLQYMAAEYLGFSLRRPSPLRPIYVTSSADLRRRARDTVRRMVTVHHASLAAEAPNGDELEAILESSFVVFHEFLRGLLSEADRADFKPSGRVTYAKFRQLWAADFARRPESERGGGPDLAWHTIRSYIKGRRESEEEEFTPGRFQELPRKQRSVTDETYAWVYEKAWTWYRRICQERGLWDDQDLATAVLESDAARGRNYGAVFCDEAQDFTPIELEIIFQLSVFASRAMTPEELHRVPIVSRGIRYRRSTRPASAGMP